MTHLLEAGGFVSHDTIIACCSLSTPTLIATAELGGFVRHRHAATGAIKAEMRMEGGADPTGMVCVGSCLWVARADGVVSVIEGETIRLVADCLLHNEGVTSIALATGLTEPLVVTVCGEGVVGVWDPTTLECPATRKVRHGGPLNAVVCCNEVAAAITHDDQHDLVLLSLPDLQTVAVGAGHSYEVLSLAIIGSTVWSGSQDESLRCWQVPATLAKGSEAQTLHPLRVLTLHCSPVHGLCAIPDESVVFSLSMDGTVAAWDAATQNVISTCTAPLNTLMSQGKHFTYCAASVGLVECNRLWFCGTDGTVRSFLVQRDDSEGINRASVTAAELNTLRDRVPFTEAELASFMLEKKNEFNNELKATMSACGQQTGLMWEFTQQTVALYEQESTLRFALWRELHYDVTSHQHSVMQHSQAYLERFQSESESEIDLLRQELSRLAIEAKRNEERQREATERLAVIDQDSKITTDALQSAIIDNQTLSVDLDLARKEIELKADELRQLKDHIGGLDKLVVELRVAQANIERVAASSATELNRTRGELMSKSEECHRLAAALSELEHNASGMQKTQQEADGAVALAVEGFNRAKLEIEAQAAELNRLTTVNANLERSNLGLKTSHREAELAAAKAVQALESTKLELSQKAEELKEVKLAAEKTLMQVSSRRDDDMRRVEQSYQKEIAEIRRMLADQMDTASLKDREILRAGQERDQAEAKRLEEERRNTLLATQLERIKHELQEVIRQRQQDGSQSSLEIGRLTQELLEMRQAAGQAKRSLTTADEALRDKDRLFESKCTELDALVQKYEDVSCEAKKSKNYISQLEGELSGAKEAVSSIRSELQGSKREWDTQRERLNNALTQAVDANRLLQEEWQAKVLALEGDRRRLQDDVSYLQNHIIPGLKDAVTTSELRVASRERSNTERELHALEALMRHIVMLSEAQRMQEMQQWHNEVATRWWSRQQGTLSAAIDDNQSAIESLKRLEECFQREGFAVTAFPFDYQQSKTPSSSRAAVSTTLPLVSPVVMRCINMARSFVDDTSQRIAMLSTSNQDLEVSVRTAELMTQNLSNELERTRHHELPQLLNQECNKLQEELTAQHNQQLDEKLRLLTAQRAEGERSLRRSLEVEFDRHLTTTVDSLRLSYEEQIAILRSQLQLATLRSDSAAAELTAMEQREKDIQEFVTDQQQRHAAKLEQVEHALKQEIVMLSSERETLRASQLDQLKQIRQLTAMVDKLQYEAAFMQETHDAVSNHFLDETKQLSALASAEGGKRVELEACLKQEQERCRQLENGNKLLSAEAYSLQQVVASLRDEMEQSSQRVTLREVQLMDQVRDVLKEKESLMQEWAASSDEVGRLNAALDANAKLWSERLEQSVTEAKELRLALGNTQTAFERKNQEAARLVHDNTVLADQVLALQKAVDEFVQKESKRQYERQQQEHHSTHLAREKLKAMEAEVRRMATELTSASAEATALREAHRDKDELLSLLAREISSGGSSHPQSALKLERVVRSVEM